MNALPGGGALVLGLAVTGQAMAAALLEHGCDVTAVDDNPTPASRAVAAALGLELIEAPDPERLDGLVAAVDMVLPSPGVPDHHPLFALAAARHVPVLSEFDLAQAWDARPLVAVTGTDGKTTVTTMLTDAFVAGGRRAEAVGNTEAPLVSAIADPDIDVFVVEASSFRLAHSRAFRPRVAAWLNFAADHLDAHRSLDAYEGAKARIWADQGDGDVAVGNVDDPTVARRLSAARASNRVSYGTHEPADWHLDGDALVGPDGEAVARTSELWRALPHDVSNALAVCASVLAAPADVTVSSAAVAHVLRTFTGLHHRVELVGESGGVRFFDDSKATAPHATLAALAGFDSVVLLAGGRNKGLDLSVLASGAPAIRAVVAMGEAAADVERAFHGIRPVRVAASMDDAVAQAALLAEPGDVVLLSPACASFDRYGSYAERGDDFRRAVTELVARRAG